MITKLQIQKDKIQEMQRERQRECDERVMQVENQNNLLEQNIHKLQSQIKEHEKKDDVILNLRERENDL